ncbi:hypothetical protein P3S68_009498 [Capsicum galapagoense]
MTRFSSRRRCSYPLLVCSLVGFLILLHFSSLGSYKGIQEGQIQERYEELEEIQTSQSRGSQSQSSQANLLIDEFLDKSSKLRHIFFPTKRTSIDPRKSTKDDTFYYYPGRIWFDTDGHPIQAHGGGILYDERSRMYYWYGEYKNGPTYVAPGKNVARVDIIGVGCYSSKDLWTWKNEGIVLAAEERDEDHDLHKSKVLERPKVIYNEKTGKYVMWMHIDDANYSKASVGIAISNSPTDPFQYLYSKRPNGFDSRDMTLFKDDDGRAYVVYSSVHNRELHIGLLDQDYVDVTNVMSRVLVGQYREAPALFKYQGTYYMITSGCSGWAPNEALAHVAESIMGPWETIGNPSVGANKVFRVTTFFAQSTYVLPISPGSFIFMADRWNPDDLRESRFVWLPLTVEEVVGSQRPRVSIFWHKRWKLLKSPV